MNGYLKCTLCGIVIGNDSQYEFLDIREDGRGRDVIHFRCMQCDQQSESYNYLKRPEEPLPPRCDTCEYLRCRCKSIQLTNREIDRDQYEKDNAEGQARALAEYKSLGTTKAARDRVVDRRCHDRQVHGLPEDVA